MNTECTEADAQRSQGRKLADVLENKESRSRLALDRLYLYM